MFSKTTPKVRVRVAFKQACLDLYKVRASIDLGISPWHVTAEQRYMAKAGYYSAAYNALPPEKIQQLTSTAEAHLKSLQEKAGLAREQVLQALMPNSGKVRPKEHPEISQGFITNTEGLDLAAFEKRLVALPPEHAAPYGKPPTE